MAGRAKSNEDIIKKRKSKPPTSGLMGMMDDLEKKQKKIKARIEKAEKLFQKTGNEAPLLAAEREQERVDSQYQKDRELMFEYPKDYQKDKSFRSDRGEKYRKKRKYFKSGGEVGKKRKAMGGPVGYSQRWKTGRKG